MNLHGLDQLSDMHLDVLREIGNIGAGNAATSLSAMLGEKVNISLPSVRILDINDAVTAMGGPENVIVGILARLYGDVEGFMLFIIEQSFARDIIATLFGQPMESDSFGEMEMSAISEVGNILIAAYTGSISTLSQLNIKISVPGISVDMVGAMLSVPAIEMASVSDTVIFIQDNFMSNDKQSPANMLFVPSIESLNRILAQLGIDL